MNNNKLLANLQSKISNSMGYRPDLSLVDTRKINKTTAHFMIEYSNNPPNSTEVMAFFNKYFDAKISPFISTAKVYQHHKVITVVAQMFVPSRDFNDFKRGSFKPVIANALYLDVELREPWEVQTRDGKKVLVKQNHEDISAIVEARKMVMLNQSSQHKTFANVANIHRFIKFMKKGDVVKFFDVDTDRLVEGEVSAVNGPQLIVKADGKSYNIQDSCVLEVVHAAKQELSDEMKYFEQAYGDKEYAKKLLRVKA
jgi:hypothetical protein